MPPAAKTASFGAASLAGAASDIFATIDAAMKFIPPDRAEQTIRKWRQRGEVDHRPEAERRAMAEDAARLAADLHLSQPSMTGSTAFDRLARASTNVSPAAIAALRGSRHRLLALESGADGADIVARDCVTGETLRVIGANPPRLPDGFRVFARVAMLGEDICCLPGPLTALDPNAFVAALGHPAAKLATPSSATKWAEEVYADAVRHATLGVADLNRFPGQRPADADDDLAAEGGELFAVAVAWRELGGRPADEALLRRTRGLADLETILDALAGAVAAKGAPLGEALGRVLLVLLEVVARRERVGSGRLTLDAIEQSIVGRRLPRGATALFISLRNQVAGSFSSAPRPSGDAELERLVQRIQGLRAKTVERGCTEHEALAAAEKVAELLDRHGLSLGELDFRAQPCEGIGIETNRKRVGPIDDCVPAIGAFFDCRVWIERGRDEPLRYVFFGMRGDVAAAQYLYEMVERAFETETNAFRAGDLYETMAGARRSATNSFQIGLARGIAGKLRSMRSARDISLRASSGRDLVPLKAAMVDGEMEKLGMSFRARSASRERRVLSDAFAAGRVAGEKFEFAQGITNAA